MRKSKNLHGEITDKKYICKYIKISAEFSSHRIPNEDLNLGPKYECKNINSSDAKKIYY
jgi:hypothetical protein